MDRSITVLDIVFEYRTGHFIPEALAIERAVRYAGADYIAVTETQCPKTAETSHWKRILPPFIQKNGIIGIRSVLKCILEIANLAGTLKSEVRNAIGRIDRVVVHLDWFRTTQFIAVFLAL